MTVLFPDVSHYQGGLNLSGADACIAKATQGTGYNDPSYTNFRAQAAQLGIPFAAYHWLDTTDAAAQARHAYAIVGSTPLMIDDEQNVINVAHTLAFINAYRALGGRVILEYAPQWVWANSGRPDLRPIVSAGLAIVSSNYPAAGYSDSGPGWGTYGGITPLIWQYTDKRSFNGFAIDFNGFRGTLDQLRALFAGTTQEDDMTPLESAEAHETHELIKWNIHPWLAQTTQAVARIEAIVNAIAAKVDIDPTELAQIAQAVTTAVAASSDALAVKLVDALGAKLPADTLSKDDLKQAVREALEGSTATIHTAP
jgi:lysozyme